jgi:hypothetical protein
MFKAQVAVFTGSDSDISLPFFVTVHVLMPVAVSDIVV